jgi:hypothetical protein
MQAALSICMLKAICCSQRAAQRPSRAYNIPADRAHQKHTRPPHRLCRSVYCKIIIAHCAPAMLNNYLRSAALKPTLVLRDPQQAQRWTRSAVAPQFRLLRSSQCDGMGDGCYFCSDRRSVFLLCPAGVLTTVKAKRRASMVVKLTVDAALHIQRLICV